MDKLNDRDKIMSYWHIDELYLQSIWMRIDAYNKGLENAVNMNVKQALTTYRGCWTLLKNVYIDYNYFFKQGFTEAYDRLKGIKEIIFSNPPADSDEFNDWNIELNKALDQLDCSKQDLIVAMAKQGSLMDHRIELSDKSKIGRVMNDW